MPYNENGYFGYFSKNYKLSEQINENKLKQSVQEINERIDLKNDGTESLPNYLN